MKFVIVTGLSGSGKSEAMRALEDIGFYCVDNLPPALIVNFAELFFHGNSNYSGGFAAAASAASGNDRMAEAGGVCRLFLSLRAAEHNRNQRSQHHELRRSFG